MKAIITTIVFFVLISLDAYGAPLVQLSGDTTPDYISAHLTASITGNKGSNPDNTSTATGYWTSVVEVTSLVFTLDSNTENHFLAMSDETTLDAVAEYLLFASLVTNAQNGTNILLTESDGGNQSGSGYSLPLTSGNYSLWFQETSNSPIDYTFTFTTEVIPEPANSALLLTCLSSVSILLFRRQRH
ncbi:MAG: hypothetical protein NWR08_07580 [Opitutales bacterium]|jgi:hypothetical protein|nr:hypothetical protein [Opitutales bacterium]